jgi:sugar/nucleoside kinase (ribokinase family)
VAVGLARLGVPVAFLGKLGDDLHGRFLLDDLAREGVDTAYLRVDPEAYTSVVIALVDPEGERMLFGWRQHVADTKLRPEEIDPDAVANAAWLHTSGLGLREIPSRDAVLHAMAMARDLDVSISLDLNLRPRDNVLPAPFRETMERAVSLADVVLGSAEELVLLAPAASTEVAARALAGGERIVVARLGPEGALAVSTDGQVVTVPAFPTEVVDTLGAGDAFDAGFIAARLEGLNIESALRWGNAVAALKIARSGARGLPSREEVESLLCASF